MARRWFDGHAAANRRAHELMRSEGAPSPDVAFARAMELAALFDVEPADALREREVVSARASWARIRAWAASRDARH
jgi:hypothetical protein